VNGEGVRFSLKALLILVTAVGLFFGYAQWRRLQLLEECDELVAAGANVRVEDSWLWPTASDSANVVFRKVGNTFENASKIYSAAGAIEHFHGLNARLKVLGIEKVLILLERQTKSLGTKLILSGSWGWWQHDVLL
jgi:hypothetical protein